MMFKISLLDINQPLILNKTRLKLLCKIFPEKIKNDFSCMTENSYTAKFYKLRVSVNNLNEIPHFFLLSNAILCHYER